MLLLQLYEYTSAVEASNDKMLIFVHRYGIIPEMPNGHCETYKQTLQYS